mgnify:FL=1
MIVFILTFFSLYGLLHLYAFLKLKIYLNPGLLWEIGIALFMVLMIFVPLIIRIAEKHGLEKSAIILSWIGYLWMALIALFFFFSIFIDLLRFLIFIFNQMSGTKFSLFPFVKLYFFIPFFISILMLVYGYFEALNIKTEHIEIRTNKVKRDVRIVQISDLHIGLIIRESKVKKVTQKIKEINPDIVVSTGDLVDGQINGLTKIVEILKELQPPFGKFAVTGNHEFYAGLKQALVFTEQAGFQILRQEGIYIDELGINIIGVDDFEVKRYDPTKILAEEEVFEKFRKPGFTILLKHRPFVNDKTRQFFDLQLSGHTHKGQFFPFSIVTALYYTKDSGCIEDTNGCHLYISRGTGTWGPPIRIFAPPEITVIDIKRLD